MRIMAKTSSTLLRGFHKAVRPLIQKGNDCMVNRNYPDFAARVRYSLFIGPSYIRRVHDVVVVVGKAPVASQYL